MWLKINELSLSFSSEFEELEKRLKKASGARDGETDASIAAYCTSNVLAFYTINEFCIL